MANEAYTSGATNHNGDTDGQYSARKRAGVQASWGSAMGWANQRNLCHRPSRHTSEQCDPTALACYASKLSARER